MKVVISFSPYLRNYIYIKIVHYIGANAILTGGPDPDET